MLVRCLNCMKEYEERYEVCPHCGFVRGTAPDEPYHLVPGIRLQNRYVIGTVVGFGGFGVIYRAWDERLETMVAIKEYYPAGIVQRIPGQSEVIIYTGNGKTEFEKGVERFLDEARNMAKFSTHPHIMNVYDFFEENHTAYIVMEFLNGISLKQYVRVAGGKIEKDVAVEIISSICEALKDIHKEGIIHRDISPDNIFICEDGKIKLIDFGAARFSTGEEEKTLSIILKPGFAPPEQYRSKSKQGPWTDVYALAATLYRIVTGIVPEESVNRIVEDNVKSPAELDPQIPENFSNALMKGMALNQDLRFQSIEDFQNAILDKKKVTDLKAELKRRKLKRGISIGAAVVVLLIGGFFTYRSFSDKKAQVELPETTVSIWVPIKENEESGKETEMLQTMVSKFQEDQPKVDIEIREIPQDLYAEEIAKAADAKTLPTVFVSDGMDDSMQDIMADVKDVYTYINANEYYFLNDAKKEIIENKKMPMGFVVPVAYVRRGKGVDIDNVEVETLDQVRKGEDALNYFIAPDMQDYVFQSLVGEDAGNIQAAHDQYIKDLEQAGQKEEATDTAKDMFRDGKLTYYLAGTNELTYMNHEVAGLYEMRPIVSDTVKGEFVDCYSISAQANDEEQHAAAVLLAYMLAEGPQKTMHIVNKNAIPVNKKAYDAFLDTNKKYEIINEYYLDKLTF